MYHLVFLIAEAGTFFHSHLASGVCRKIDNDDPSKYPERQRGVLQ